jgi:mRNA interferase HigB
VWIITEKRLKQAMTRHPNATPALTDWIIHVRAAQFANFHDLRQVFGSADVAYDLTIFLAPHQHLTGLGRFDIAGNNYRLIADVDYAMGRIYIKAFLTHAEYDEWNKQMRKSKRR